MRRSKQRNALVALIAAALLAVSAVLPALAHGTIDQANDGPFNNGTGLLILGRNGQGFVPSLPYTTGFDVFVYNQRGVDVDATFRAAVRVGVSGPVVAWADGAATVPATANQPWRAQRVHLDISAPVALSGQHTLWLAQFDLEPKLKWALTYAPGGGPYPHGQWCRPNFLGGCAFSLSDYDFGFATYGTVNRPPDCTAAAPSTSEIWPPNGKLVVIAIDGVTDPDGDPVSIAIDAISQDEPVGNEADGAGVGTGVAQVRAERDGDGDGRIYAIAFTASAPLGAACTGEVAVGVPHDQGQGDEAVDSGDRFDSTAP